MTALPTIDAPIAPVVDAPIDSWADQTRRVLTHDLLVRAAHARPGEARALEFRVLHLNLPLVAGVADRMGLSESQRRRVEHHALDGLHEAVRRYDPYDEGDFEDLAVSLVEQQIRAHLRWRQGLRLAGPRES
jgi:DNA-directed RNA polymerase specialized sigma subunit